MTGIAAVIAAVLAVSGILTIVTVEASVTAVVDTQLTGSMEAFEHSVVKFHDQQAGGGAVVDPDATRGEPGYVKPFVDYVGHGPGTLIALVADGAVVDSARFTQSNATALDVRTKALIEEAVTADGSERQNIELGSLGGYRLEFLDHGDGETLVAGVSLATPRAAVQQEAIVIAILAVLALAVTIIGAIIVVRLGLRPLSRVAAAAEEVSTLQLERGDTGIDVRVDQADTDPRTEIGKVGEALNGLIDHVDRALAVRAATDKRMRRFVTDASHELRTPLAAIQGYAELTRQDSESLPPMTEHALARIESEATRMSSLVSELLLLARLDEGQDLHLDDVDLSDLVAAAVSDAAVSAPAHHWSVDVPERAIVVRGDRERLHQLVVNLLSNAAVHTPAGTSVVTRISAPKSPDEPQRASLTIADDGPGIDEAFLPELFDRFARADSSRSRAAGSTGLGLAIALSIAEGHEGSIEVASSSAGTTFTVTLPWSGPSEEHPAVRPAADGTGSLPETVTSTRG
ncbi:cell wall metabolism sensor histidine kinase WalK [Plantibacter sp. H53]|uniref:sensor histidine kinase n=1 Tax=Plantibacter sp. H53 TaxID=1827323 RepID=UPI0018D4C7A1|nr:HAMP domain-containing sensor histidine kinase [Plantibacter sp. H53]